MAIAHWLQIFSSIEIWPVLFMGLWDIAPLDVTVHFVWTWALIWMTR